MRSLPTRTVRVLVTPAASVLAGAAPQMVVEPWRAMKERHFGGAHVPLHASELRQPTDGQLEALSQYFHTRAFGRFGATMTIDTALPDSQRPLDLMPGILRNRWTEIASRCVPAPVEIALLFESSRRLDVAKEQLHDFSASVRTGWNRLERGIHRIG
jgi:hypothetical protein